MEAIQSILATRLVIVNGDAINGSCGLQIHCPPHVISSVRVFTGTGAVQIVERLQRNTIDGPSGWVVVDVVRGLPSSLE